MRILYVEDEKYLADAVIHLLKKSDIAVDWAENGRMGLELALNNTYDCLVLDIMLPELLGVDILRGVRQHKLTVPIIMLSALSEVDDKVNSLELGADDYLAKPFKTAELIARIKALVRRPPLQLEQTLNFADLEYDPSNRTLNGLELTTKEAAILEILLRHPDHVQPKAQLLARVWGSDASLNDNYVEAYISYLRKKLRASHSRAKIKTIRGLGYKLVDTAA